MAFPNKLIIFLLLNPFISFSAALTCNSCETLREHGKTVKDECINEKNWKKEKCEGASKYCVHVLVNTTVNGKLKVIFFNKYV